MPKILINEDNQTSSGAIGSYENYSVLITGYMGSPDPTKGTAISADENGVYEFSSLGAFLATIGDAPVAKQDAAQNISEYHYGNKMAQELLTLGYQVIYKVINRVSDMNSETFWEIFKDRASYDFRFISHGMLETCYDVEEHTSLYNRYNEIMTDIEEFNKIPEWVEANWSKVLANWVSILNYSTGLDDAALPSGITQETTFDQLTSTNKQEAYNIRYKLLIAEDDKVFGSGATQLRGEGYTGFISDSTNTPYGNYSTASAYLVKADEDTPALAETNILAAIAEHEDNGVTPSTFDAINVWIAKLASYIVTSDSFVTPGRGDCIALIELNEDLYYEVASDDRPESLIIDGINSHMTGITAEYGKYCAMTVPSVYYKGKSHKFPGAFHYLVCFKNSLNSGFAEWYAAAGYSRGVSGSYVVEKTSVKLGEIAINALEPRNIINQEKQPFFACNVIANFRGNYYLWGNRTAATLYDANASDKNDLDANHFLNIRQLCATIKKQLYVSCRRYTFDPNSDTLWINFVNSIAPTLDEMKADQGIKDYRIIKVVEANPKKATLKAKIRIIPIEAVEDFDITVTLEDSFGETSVTAEG